MSPREMSADHLWSLTIPVSPTDPKLTPKVTPYGADALAIPGHPWTRKSAIPSAKTHRWTPSDAGRNGGNRPFNQGVAGSIPARPTNKKSALLNDPASVVLQ